MKATPIISINEARIILREFNAPIELQQDNVLSDIINRLDSIAYIYNSARRDSVESSEDAPTEEDSTPQE